MHVCHFFLICFETKKVSIVYDLTHLHRHYYIMFAKFLQCDKHLLRNFNVFIFKKKVGNYRTLVKAVECISLYKTTLVLL